MGIKMVVTDLDGTLLREDKTISERTVQALLQCRKAGIKVVYATGRGDSAKVLAPSDLFDGFVRMNGAVAFIGDNLLYDRLIHPDMVRDLLIAADHAGIQIASEISGMHYANFNVSQKWPWIQRYELADFHTLDCKAEKVYAIAESPWVVEFIKSRLPAGLYLYVSRDDIAMIMHEEAKKSKAVAALAGHWGIKQNEIVAFGDDTNDIDLLEYCGVGIAMGNALDEVKAVSDFVCDTNDNDGVAKWLEDNKKSPRT